MPMYSILSPIDSRLMPSPVSIQGDFEVPLVDRIPRHVESRLLTSADGDMFWRPATDVYENDTHIIVHVDLPGVPKKEINIEFDGNELIISGSHNAPFESATCRVRERAIGMFKKVVQLPSGIMPEAIKAEYQDGLLALKIEKPSEGHTKHITADGALARVRIDRQTLEFESDAHAAVTVSWPCASAGGHARMLLRFSEARMHEEPVLFAAASASGSASALASASASSPLSAPATPNGLSQQALGASHPRHYFAAGARLPASEIRIQIAAAVAEMTAARHPRIACVFGVVDEDSASEPMLGIVLEAFESPSLYTFLADPFRSPLPWTTKYNMMYDVTQALNFLHTRGLRGWAVRSSAIGVTPDMRCKLIYVPAALPETFIADAMQSDDPCVPAAGETPSPLLWLAPEMLLSSALGAAGESAAAAGQPSAHRDDVKCDVFALGIVLWEIVSEQPPHKDRTLREAAAAVRSGVRGELDESATPGCLPHFIARCWAHRPAQRVSSTEALKTLGFHQLDVCSFKRLSTSMPDSRSSRTGLSPSMRGAGAPQDAAGAIERQQSFKSPKRTSMPPPYQQVDTGGASERRASFKLLAQHVSSSPSLLAPAVGQPTGSMRASSSTSSVAAQSDSPELSGPSIAKQAWFSDDVKVSGSAVPASPSSSARASKLINPTLTSVIEAAVGSGSGSGSLNQGDVGSIMRPAVVVTHVDPPGEMLFSPAIRPRVGDRPAGAASAQNKVQLEADFEIAARMAEGKGMPADWRRAVQLFADCAAAGYPPAQAKMAALYEQGRGVKKNPERAAALYAAAADQGDHASLVSLGMMYLNGNGIERNVNQAVAMFRKAMDKNVPAAMYCLGTCYVSGVGVERDYAKATQLFQRASDLGHEGATGSLGVRYEMGQGVPKDIGKAVQLYRTAAERGNPSAQNNLGLCYKFGRGVAKDIEHAAELFKLSAAQGDHNGECNLGLCYKLGDGLPVDLERARKMFESAEHKGNRVAAFQLGQMLFDGQSVKQDISRAVQLFLKSAEQGYAGAQLALGKLYENGTGVPRDRTLAAQMYTRAADQGNVSAKHALALWHLAGVGRDGDTGTNLDAAVKLLKSASAKGHGPSTMRLAQMHMAGEGVGKDLARAVELMTLATTQDCPAAVTALGVMHRDGIGVSPAQPHKAVELFERSAAADDPDGLFNLGLALNAGAGVERDPTRAADMFERAAKLGHAAAKQHLESGKSAPTKFRLKSLISSKLGLRSSISTLTSPTSASSPAGPLGTKQTPNAASPGQFTP
ncbi:hypothetical protein HK105_201447 [Polyrhizophydium stewartii]|uniref:SHSP domain-containing protein n=1 Tax=Polyrhizophydium stewartii TaxID=2732419 RepID=A0ABR4NI28_9FUNG